MIFYIESQNMQCCMNIYRKYWMDLIYQKEQENVRGLIFEEENQIFKGLTPLTNDFFVVVVCYTWKIPWSVCIFRLFQGSTNWWYWQALAVEATLYYSWSERIILHYVSKNKKIVQYKKKSKNFPVLWWFFSMSIGVAWENKNIATSNNWTILWIET